MSGLDSARPRSGEPRDVRTLPKAHLHLHFTGSMRHETLLELAERDGIVLPDATGGPDVDLGREGRVLATLIRLGVYPRGSTLPPERRQSSSSTVTARVRRP